MRSTVSRASGSRVVLEVEVAAEDMAPDFQEAYRSLARSVRIPGFRPGKAPAAIVERVVGRERVRSEALDRIVQRAYRSALTEQGVDAVDQPAVDVKSFEEGQSLQFQATVSVRPKVTLGDYRAQRMVREVAPVQAEDVAAALEDVRRTRGTWVPVGDEPVAEGHLVILHTKGMVGDTEPVEERQVEAVVGQDQIRAEIDRAIRGLHAGGGVDVEIQFAEDDASRALAGRTARLHVDVLEVKRLELPPLDDAFAQEVAGRKTLEELRSQVGNRLQAAAEAQADTALVDKALATAVGEAEIEELPEVFIQRAVDNLLADLERRLAQARVSLAAHLAQQGKTLEGLRDELRPAAEGRVKTELVIEAIAADADLVPTLEDMDSEIVRLATASRVPAPAFRKEALKPGNWAAIRFGLMQRRVATWLHALALGSPEEEALARARYTAPEVGERAGSEPGDAVLTAEGASLDPAAGVGTDEGDGQA